MNNYPFALRAFSATVPGIGGSEFGKYGFCPDFMHRPASWDSRAWCGVGMPQGSQGPDQGSIGAPFGYIFDDLGRQLGSILDHFGVKIWRFGGLGASGGASGSHVGPHGRPEGPKWPKPDEKAHPWDPLLGTIFGPKSTKSGQRAPESVKGGLRGPSRRSLRFWPLFGTGPGRGHVLQIQHWLYPNHISASLLASVLEPLGNPWGSCWALWGPKVGHKGQKWRSKNRPKKKSEKSHATVRSPLRAGTCCALKIVQSDSQGIPKHPMTTPLVPCRHGGGSMNMLYACGDAPPPHHEELACRP